MPRSRHLAVLIAAAAAAGAAPPAAAAVTATAQLDVETARRIGDRGIVPSTPAPARAGLEGSRVVVRFPVSGARLRGGVTFTRGGTRVTFTRLRLSGRRIKATSGGRTYDLLVLRGVRRSASALSFRSAVLGGSGARLLRLRFADRVFRGGTRYFTAGRIPR